ncbi:hypothetical protein AHAS_Ahas16G0229600 [Arachis hypogaea]
MLNEGGYLFTNKSAFLVSFRWLPLLEDFDRCRRLCWGFELLSHTYHSLYDIAWCDVMDIIRCILLMFSWIYHRFPSFCPVGYDALKFLLASR